MTRFAVRSRATLTMPKSKRAYCTPKPLRRMPPMPANPIEAYELIRLSNGSIDVVVTKGALAGRIARIITTDPAAAYFRAKDASDASRPRSQDGGDMKTI